MWDSEAAMKMFRDKAEKDGRYAIAYSIAVLADQVRFLGTGNAASNGVGAIELLAMTMTECVEQLSGMPQFSEAAPRRPYPAGTSSPKPLND